MSKHDLLGLVRSAAGELGKHGIKVHCVPLACNVHNQEPSEVEMVSASMSRFEGIILKAKNVAEAALFLASDEFACVSGHNLIDDRGASVFNTALAMMLDGLNNHGGFYMFN